jgi:5-formyltetrahydrofolate cyclo-ligase
MPLDESITVNPDILFVPLICFSPVSKQRIGYGGGYYDYYLNESAKAKRNMISIGIGL